jgi:hypothetical protein
MISQKKLLEDNDVYKSMFFQRLGIFQAPKLTSGHKYMGIAAIMGFCFVFLHIITIIVTIVTTGTNWGMSAWMLDLTGFVAGGFMALLCRDASSKTSTDSAPQTFWVFIWAAITICVRCLDILMLFGIVKIEAIYITPTGPVLIANIFSEIIIAVPYVLFALIGSVKILWYSND